MRIANMLISARFLCTTGHLTALLLLFSTIKSNVTLGVGNGDATQAYNSCIGALVFGIFCFVFDFSGIFFGNSLFSPTVRPLLHRDFLSSPSSR
jgi:hypothetical protein